jgi:hypothetical protein
MGLLDIGHGQSVHHFHLWRYLRTSSLQFKPNIVHHDGPRLPPRPLSTSNLHIHFSFLYLALIGFEWKGQGYMTSIHETTTTRGTIMMNTGRIDIGGLGLRNESLVMVTCQG